MKRFLLLLLVLVLGACTPSYFVMLTRITPDGSYRCSGSVLDPNHILTADHCLALGTLRIETQQGKTTYAYPLTRFPELDVAVLRTVQPLDLPSYASLGEVDKTQPAYLYGVCPHHFSTTPRKVRWVSDDWQTNYGIACDKWIVENSACGSDSGGPVIQNGKLVGMTLAVKSWWILPAVEGKEVCIVPSKVLMGEVWTSNN